MFAKSQQSDLYVKVNLQTLPAILEIFTIAPCSQFLSANNFAKACPIRKVPCKQRACHSCNCSDAFQLQLTEMHA